MDARLRLVAIDRFTLMGSVYAKSWHRHDFHELICVLGHGYAVQVGTERHHGGPGSLFIYPQGLRHRPVPAGALPPRILLLQWSGPDPGLPLRLVDQDGRLLSALLWLWELSHARTRTPTAVIDGLLAALVHQLGRAAAPDAEGMLLERARTYLCQNLAYDLSLAELAEHCGVSPATLNRAFRSELGISPMRHRRRLRAELALSMVREGSRSLTEIARATGYLTAQHLSRVMRAELGRPPSAWRHARGGSGTDWRAALKPRR